MSEIVSYRQLREIRKNWGTFVLTSLPGDPLHIGHVRLLLESAKLACQLSHPFVVLVNDDEFLMRKKGFVFMPLAERMEVIAAIRGVDYVAPWSSPTQFVADAILQLKPGLFTKGGDRSSPADIDPCELQACREVYCSIVYGVGGSTKVQSSSLLAHKVPAAKQLLQQRKSSDAGPQTQWFPCSP